VGTRQFPRVSSKAVGIAGPPAVCICKLAAVGLARPLARMNRPATRVRSSYSLAQLTMHLQNMLHILISGFGTDPVARVAAIDVNRLTTAFPFVPKSKTPSGRPTGF